MIQVERRILKTLDVNNLSLTSSVLNTERKYKEQLDIFVQGLKQNTF